MMNLNELNEKLMSNNMGIIYEAHEFDEVLSGKSPTEIIMMTKGDDFNLNDPYFEFDGYGNLVSYNNLEDLLDLYDDVE